MKYRIEHELPGRIRLRCAPESFSQQTAPAVAALMETQAGVTGVKASWRTGSLLIHHDGDHRSNILMAVEIIDQQYINSLGDEVIDNIPRPPSLSESVLSVLGGALFRAMLPAPLRMVATLWRALPVLGSGINSLWNLNLDVNALDASAVGVSLLRRDFSTAGTIMTLLALGSVIEDCTRRQSREGLARSLALQIDQVWIREEGLDRQIPFSSLQIGDAVVVRAGSVIPVDGLVIDGEGMVNQASMTGESVSVHRVAGLSVYAGTVLEEGELLVSVVALHSDTRLQQIVQLIDESEALKAGVQSRAEHLADAIVPYSFLLAGVTWLLTGNLLRASAALMVDYSCAIKLATPLAILSAMKEGARDGVLIKGGKFLEALADADTIVFDKTGTLTVSEPTVVEIIPFGNRSARNVLKVAACLEEHFPHSLARAVVRKAEEEGIEHREEHAEVEYAIAHGIVSRLHGKRVIIGSAHFVFDDEGVPCSEKQRQIIEEKGQHYSLLFLTMDNRLAGLICLDDPLRPEARQIVSQLKNLGIKKSVMLTGDSKRVAAHVASQLNIDEYHAEVLPHEKTEFINQLIDEGHKVLMVGDGINDSPALAAATAGISLSTGADVAQEVADIVLVNPDLQGLVKARSLGTGVLQRISENYQLIVGVNSQLLILGLGGLISPAFSALLHNLATIAASLRSLRPFEAPQGKRKELPPCR